MQVDLLKAWAITQVVILVRWLADVCGLEVVRAGWRQIPSGHCDFDPALAEHFKKAGMRNGKHINMAVNYAVIAKWNRSNAKRRDDARTYGSDSYYARHYTEVDRKTWARHMDELAALGLVIISSVAGKPAYEAVAYQFVNNGLLLGQNLHAQGGGHGDHATGYDGQRGAHDAHHQYRESKHSLLSALNVFSSAAPAHAADAGQDVPTIRSIMVVKPESPDYKAQREGSDELLMQIPPANLPRPTPPGSARPPLPGDTTAQDSTLDELRGFFTGCDAGQIKTLIEQHGSHKIFETIATVKALPNVDNPPGLVRHLLGMGAGRYSYPARWAANDEAWLGDWKPKRRLYEPAADA